MSNLLVIQVITRPDGGGAERIARALASRLRFLGIKSYAIFFQNPSNITLYENEFNIQVDSVKSIQAAVALRTLIKRLIRKDHFNVIHAHLTYPLYLTPIATAFLPVSLVFSEHDTWNRRRAHPMLRYVERIIYNRYSLVVSVSRATHAKLHEWLGAESIKFRHIVILNGSRLITRLKLQSARQSRGIRLISIGSLIHKKGFDLSIRAVSKCRDLVDNYTILGEGSDRVQLESLISQLNLGDVVSMPGYSENISGIIQRADLGLIPSRWEGFGLVAIEMLSAGVPLVASDVEGMNEVLRDCSAAHLIKPDDVDSLVKGIRYANRVFLTDSTVAEIASAYANNFSLEHMISQYLEAYGSFQKMANRQ